MAASVDAKLLRQTKFPPEFSKKVDMNKVNIEVMKKWIAGKISDILGSEDDVVIELCFNLLEGDRFPDIKRLQIQLTGFLDKDTARFCKELWSLCLSAQNSPQGVPKELLEAKKLELMQEKIDAEKASTDARLRADRERERDRELNGLRERERADRSARTPRGSNISRRYNADRAVDRGTSWRRSRPRDRSSSPKLRETDTYVPKERGHREHNDGRERPSSRSPYRHHPDGSNRSSYRQRRSYSSSDYSRSPSPQPKRKRRDSSRSITPSSRSSRRRHRLSESSPHKRRVHSTSSDASDLRKRRKESHSDGHEAHSRSPARER